MRLARKPTATADLVAVIAVVLAMLVIVWARVALEGTADIEEALTGEISSATPAGNSQHAEALARNRWIAGFTQ